MSEFYSRQNLDDYLTIVLLQDTNTDGSGDETTTLEKRQELACNKLANDAVRRLSADNVTVVLVTIRKHLDTS